MSYTVMVFDPHSAPRDADAFVSWHWRQLRLLQQNGQVEPHSSAWSLQAWFADMDRTFPLGLPSDLYGDVGRTAVYLFRPAVIFAQFAAADALVAYHSGLRYAAQRQAGFYTVASRPAEIWWPAGRKLLRRLPGAALHVQPIRDGHDGLAPTKQVSELPPPHAPPR